MMQAMIQRRFSASVLLALVPLVASTACTATQAPTAQQAMARLQAVIGDAPCRNDGECRSVAVGHRACGGPDMFLVWSTRHSSAEALERAVAEFNAAGQTALPGRTASICVFLHDPGARCVRPAAAAGPGQCQLGTGGGPPAAGSPSLPVR